MEAMAKKFFDQKLGEFVEVAPGNMEFSFSGGSGKFKLSKGQIKSDVFNNLHFPIALRGGYIEDITMSMEMGFLGDSPAKVDIKNVCLVFGPHQTDWSWDQVYRDKSRLVDLVMKIWELKSSKKKKPSKGGYFADMIKRRIEDMAQRFLGNLVVNISNVHYRYEDATTQSVPFAAGFKIGSIQVTSAEADGLDPQKVRATGEWRHTKERCADPFVTQVVKTRRISAYWDVGKEEPCQGCKAVPRNKLIAAKGPVGGEEVKEVFKRLNIRETFSACVVEEILKRYPPDHKKRKILEGPCFRERLDFHQYVFFPASCNAQIAANRWNDSTKLQKVPLYDADVVFEDMQVALDSEQVRSVNELLSYKKTFERKDNLFRTRPQRQIRELPGIPRGPPPGQPKAGKGRSSSSSARPRELTQAEKNEWKEVVTKWWLHALEGVRVMCGIPRRPLHREELTRKKREEKTYVNLCVAAHKERKESPQVDPHELPSNKELRIVQMKMQLKEILDWRLLARDKIREEEGQVSVDQELQQHQDRQKEAQQTAAVIEPVVEKPKTMQVRVQFKSFEGFFLVVADSQWKQALQMGIVERALKKDATLPKVNTQKLTRQLVVKGQVTDVRMQAIQKGSKHRIARWVQLEVGGVSALNCNTKGPKSAARDMLSITPFEHATGVTPVCLFFGATTYEMKDDSRVAGDPPMAAVLEPWAGLSGHAKEFPPGVDHDGEAMKRLGFPGFPKDKDDNVKGKLMTFGFVRVGQVQALDYTPFRRRIMHFLKRGKDTYPTDLVRRPEPIALDRELLVKLQRKVQLLTGKSDMLGSMEGVLDGVHARMVDQYNSQNVLCKQVSLAPMRWKATRNGKPQSFNMQFHQILRPGEQQELMMRLHGDMFGLLPWKVAMLLQKKDGYSMVLDGYPDPALGLPGVDQAKAVKDASPIMQIAQAAALGDKSAQTVVLEGANFVKWTRHGTPHKRFVCFDEKYNAIVWKTSKTSDILGLLPLSKIQDVCTGVHTPVLHKARGSPKFREDRAWSIVTNERTLDLQAETVAQQHQWVTELELRFKNYVRQESSASQTKLPEMLQAKLNKKNYPEKFRSPLCNLRTKISKLQAMEAATAATQVVV